MSERTRRSFAIALLLAGVAVPVWQLLHADHHAAHAPDGTGVLLHLGLVDAHEHEAATDDHGHDHPEIVAAILPVDIDPAGEHSALQPSLQAPSNGARRIAAVASVAGARASPGVAGATGPRAPPLG